MKQVAAAIIVRESKILVCQRTRHQTMPLKWEFPGGKIEPGEQPEQALRRELEEELGIRAVVGRKVVTLQHNYAASNSSRPKAGHGEDRDLIVELHFFLVQQFRGEIENRIFRDVQWVGREQMPAYDFLEADVSLVQDIAAGKVRLTGPSPRKRR